MKKLPLGASALSFMVTAAAFAADLPSVKAPMVAAPPLPLWTGFYAGLNAGGTFGASSGVQSLGGDLFDDSNPARAGAAAAAGASGSSTAGSNKGGFIGGGQVGYNYQFDQRIVVGIETDIQGVAGSNGGADELGLTPDPLGSPTLVVTTRQLKGSLDYLGTVRGRVGFLISPTWLVYVTGGLAYGGANLSATYVSGDVAGVYGLGTGTSSFSDSHTGWTLGGGLQWMFMPNWSAKLEYLYYDLGSLMTSAVVASVNNKTGAAGYAYVASSNASLNGHVVRAGVNYHFNWAAPAPVLAKF